MQDSFEKTCRLSQPPAPTSGILAPCQQQTEFRGNIGPGKSVKAFLFRVERILAEAKSLSVEMDGSNAEVNRWMGIAKGRSMKWVEGLYFSVDRMKTQQKCDG